MEGKNIQIEARKICQGLGVQDAAMEECTAAATKKLEHTDRTFCNEEGTNLVGCFTKDENLGEWVPTIEIKDAEQKMNISNLLLWRNVNLWEDSVPRMPDIRTEVAGHVRDAVYEAAEEVFKGIFAPLTLRGIKIQEIEYNEGKDSFTVKLVEGNSSSSPPNPDNDAQLMLEALKGAVAKGAEIKIDGKTLNLKRIDGNSLNDEEVGRAFEAYVAAAAAIAKAVAEASKLEDKKVVVDTIETAVKGRGGLENKLKGKLDVAKGEVADLLSIYELKIKGQVKEEKRGDFEKTTREGKYTIKGADGKEQEVKFWELVKDRFQQVSTYQGLLAAADAYLNTIADKARSLGVSIPEPKESKTKVKGEVGVNYTYRGGSAVEVPVSISIERPVGKDIYVGGKLAVAFSHGETPTWREESPATQPDEYSPGNMFLVREVSGKFGGRYGGGDHDTSVQGGILSAGPGLPGNTIAGDLPLAPIPKLFSRVAGGEIFHGSKLTEWLTLNGWLAGGKVIKTVFMLDGSNKPALGDLALALGGGLKAEGGLIGGVKDKSSASMNVVYQRYHDQNAWAITLGGLLALPAKFALGADLAFADAGGGLNWSLHMMLQREFQLSGGKYKIIPFLSGGVGEGDKITVSASESSGYGDFQSQGGGGPASGESSTRRTYLDGLVGVKASLWNRLELSLGGGAIRTGGETGAVVIGGIGTKF